MGNCAKFSKRVVKCSAVDNARKIDHLDSRLLDNLWCAVQQGPSQLSKWRTSPCREHGERAKSLIGETTILGMTLTTNDDIVDNILALYSSLKFSPPAGKYTILASFYLTNTVTSSHKIISLGTGTKCLPTAKLPSSGEALHDSHAEILARRGALRWFLEEIQRQGHSPAPSEWICRRRNKYALANGIQLCMYISTVPCTRHLFPPFYNI